MGPAGVRSGQIQSLSIYQLFPQNENALKLNITAASLVGLGDIHHVHQQLYTTGRLPLQTLWLQGVLYCILGLLEQTLWVWEYKTATIHISRPTLQDMTDPKN